MDLLLSTALAASPELETELPADRRIAQATWQAAAERTGWEPPVHPVVVIERPQKQDEPLSHALSDEQGLHRIRLKVGAGPWTT